MRWEDRVCPQCGGALYADYAAVALTCLECGHHQPPPKPPRSRGAPPLEQPSPRSSRAPQPMPGPLVALVDVRPGSRQLIEGLCVAHGCQVVCCSPPPSSADDAAITDADLLVVEADRGGLAVVLARRLRAQVPAVPIALVLACWSEYESDARNAVEFVVHAPLREKEIIGVLETVGSYGGWLPSPLLAATYRARVTD